MKENALTIINRSINVFSKEHFSNNCVYLKKKKKTPQRQIVRQKMDRLRC